MTNARISWWKFKSGMRDEGVKRMNARLDEVKAQNGFRGIVSMLSMHNPDNLTLVSFWDSEAAMNANQKGLFQKVSSELSDILAEPPQFANQTVGITEMAKVYA